MYHRAVPKYLHLARFAFAGLAGQQINLKCSKINYLFHIKLVALTSHILLTASLVTNNVGGKLDGVIEKEREKGEGESGGVWVGGGNKSISMTGSNVLRALIWSYTVKFTVKTSLSRLHTPTHPHTHTHINTCTHKHTHTPTQHSDTMTVLKTVQTDSCSQFSTIFSTAYRAGMKNKIEFLFA